MRCIMRQYVTITIDGGQVQAPRGTSVLDAAIEFGVCIPHLCHVPGLSDIGACRLCIVEHVKNGYAKVTTSCTLLVEEGMVIRTNTEKIRMMRHNIAELLVSQAPNSRAIQDIALRCGVRRCAIPLEIATASFVDAVCGLVRSFGEQERKVSWGEARIAVLTIQWESALNSANSAAHV